MVKMELPPEKEIERERYREFFRAVVAGEIVIPPREPDPILPLRKPQQSNE